MLCLLIAQLNADYDDLHGRLIGHDMGVRRKGGHVPNDLRLENGQLAF